MTTVAPVMPRLNVRLTVYDTVGGIPMFLLLKNGYWQTPQGGVETETRNETVFEAAFRELWEETRLLPYEIRRTGFETEYDAYRDGEPIHVISVDCIVGCDHYDPVEIGLSGDKHVEYAWMSFENAYRHLDRFPEQRKAFVADCLEGKLVSEERVNLAAISDLAA